MIKEQFVEKKRGHNKAKYIIRYHISFVTKYRRKLINSTIVDLIKKSAERAASVSNNFEIEVMEIDSYCNYIHFFIKASPAIAPYEIVHKLKQTTTYDIWHTDNTTTTYMRKFYKKQHHLWTNGYFCSTIGNTCTEIEKRYIESQG